MQPYSQPTLTPCGISAESQTVVSLADFLKLYLGENRTLLRNADVGEAGMVRIVSRSGANLTSEAVLDALKLREER